MNAVMTDTDGGIRGRTWDFGDGGTSTSSSSSLSRTYAVAGTYTITLVVTDNWGKTTTVTHNVTVG